MTRLDQFRCDAGLAIESGCIKADSTSTSSITETPRHYFLRLRFSRTRMLTSMGVPSKPKVSRRRRVMKRR
jgi:hypothetical protein